jgi:hypothetical protein
VYNSNQVSRCLCNSVVVLFFSCLASCITGSFPLFISGHHAVACSSASGFSHPWMHHLNLHFVCHMPLLKDCRMHASLKRSCNKLPTQYACCMQQDGLLHAAAMLASIVPPTHLTVARKRAPWAPCNTGALYSVFNHNVSPSSLHAA